MTKVAVIGVGSMGRNHARLYRELEGAELVAVSDSNPDVLQDAASRLNVPGYPDYHQMLESEQPEAVSIAVPTAFHAQVVANALEAGAHVLVEKPIAATLDDALCMIEQAKALSRQLMVGHIVRFNPALTMLRAKLQAGELGRIYQILCRRVGPFPTRIQDVGVVIDLAPHDLDLMRFLTGLDPLRVYAEMEQRLHTDHEDLVLGLLRFPGGVIGSIEINWLTPTKQREVLVLGERGLFQVDDLTQDLYFFENNSLSHNLWPSLETMRGVSEGLMLRYAIQRYEPLKAELQAFLHAIQTGEPVPINGQDGLAALRLAFAMLESGRTHQVIEV